MSAALTKAAKDAAIQKALSRAFDGRIAELDKGLTALADALYEHHFGAEAKRLVSTPERWLTLRSTIGISKVGWGRRAVRSDERFHAQWPGETLELSGPRPVPSEYGWSSPCLVPETQALKAQADKVAKEHQAIAQEMERLRSSLNALLAPIRTYKKLREVWPEGEDLFLPEPAPTFPVQDARLTLEINKALGITKTKGASK